MGLIRLAITRPIAVVAAVVMLMLFGILALRAIPIQIAPDINRPILSIDTTWPGAAPEEVEREIIARQEEELKGLEGVRSMTSRAYFGRGSITLEFALGQDMDRALLLVSNRLDGVQGYPDEADEPALSTASSEDNPIARFMLKAAPGRDRPLSEEDLLLRDTLGERLERVEGVGLVEIFGTRERELQVEIRPDDLAAYGLTVPDVVQALRGANAAISGGTVDQGKRRYVVRVEGALEDPDQVAAVLLRTGVDPVSGRLARVTVGDIAQVRFGYKRQDSFIRHNGQPGVLVNILRESGANVLDVMARVQAELDRMAEGPLRQAGITVVKTYDETVYIRSALDLVTENLIEGIALSAAILLLFLRSARATFTVCITIPISLIGTFVAVSAMGLSLNVISLAGLAFAVGNVVDAAIVVVETIYRLRQQGVPLRQAAIQGTELVWRAILISTLATVLVFAPVLISATEVGQLFRDIAVAYCISVSLSLIIGITVVPMLAATLFGRIKPDVKPVRLPLIDPAGHAFERAVRAYALAVMRHRGLALIVAATLTALSAGITWAFLPKLEYLPEGNRNQISGQVTPPPGYNPATTTGIAERVEAATRPLWVTETGMTPDPDGRPKIADFFFVSRGSSLFIGAVAAEPERVRELVQVMAPLVRSEPGAFGFVSQPSIFGRGVGGARSIELDISGDEVEDILPVAQRAVILTNEALPPAQGTQLRPRPGLELGAPEIRLIPDRVRLADAALTATALGQSVDAMNDGLRVAEITVEGQRMDLTLMGPAQGMGSTQGIAELPIVTGRGTILPVGDLAQVALTAGPVEIWRKERRRVITLEIRPAAQIPLETAMERIQAGVIDRLEAEGLPAGVSLRLTGTADQLTAAWSRLSVDLTVSLIIVFLAMAVMFGSVIYPTLIMVTVPLATAGAFLGLALLNLYVRQPLDMLTMMGFVILIGMVVNNAILIVDQSLIHHREEGMAVDEAVAEATGTRIRPIFMSSLANILGLMPMVLSPGAGSELYRGLAMVILGGLSLSALLTLAVTPALLSLVMRTVERRHAAGMAPERVTETTLPLPPPLAEAPAATILPYLKAAE